MVERSEPENIGIILQFLTQCFQDVTLSTYTECFVYHDGTQTSELAIDLEFLNNLRPEQLKAYMERTVLPTLRVSSGKIIRAGADGISIRSRQSRCPL